MCCCFSNFLPFKYFYFWRSFKFTVKWSKRHRELSYTLSLTFNCTNLRVFLIYKIAEILLASSAGRVPDAKEEFPTLLQKSWDTTWWLNNSGGNTAGAQYMTAECYTKMPSDFPWTFSKIFKKNDHLGYLPHLPTPLKNLTLVNISESREILKVFNN